MSLNLFVKASDFLFNKECPVCAPFNLPFMTPSVIRVGNTCSLRNHTIGSDRDVSTLFIIRIVHFDGHNCFLCSSWNLLNPSLFHPKLKYFSLTCWLHQTLCILFSLWIFWFVPCFRTAPNPSLFISSHPSTSKPKVKQPLSLHLSH